MNTHRGCQSRGRVEPRDLGMLHEVGGELGFGRSEGARVGGEPFFHGFEVHAVRPWLDEIVAALRLKAS